MMEPILFGAAYSVYTRIVLLALLEKGAPFRLEGVDIFAVDKGGAIHAARHPFGKIPAFDHDGFVIYETAAIARYVDETFDGPPLQPRDPKARARMNQAIGILDSYAYRCWVWDIYVERVDKPREGKLVDEARIEAALPGAEACLRALGELIGEGQWLAGEALTLADLHAAPMVACLAEAPEGARALEAHPLMRGWWERMKARPLAVRVLGREGSE
ncbi:glutathione S-transferase family protein [Inquilinus sp. CAU 1745]|uniref:glutathione S-transferase family protein n=1 Tax=Inquilinus sp. CAU 1745 TaxID=3140369 RepID=UPI00325B4940